MAEPNMIALQSRDDELARPSPLACMECRRKHVRCDAGSPECARCVTAGLQCKYISSRRGGGRKRTRQDSPTETRQPPIAPFQERGSCETMAEHQAGSTARTELDPISSQHSNVEATQGVAFYSDPGNLEFFQFDYDHGYNMQSTLQPINAPESSPAAWVDDEALVNLYYAFYHRTHPILVPRHLYQDQNYPKYLRLTIQFIGSHYSTTLSSDRLRTLTAKALSDDSQRTASMVQARLLFAIALHARYEVVEAEQTLYRAVDLALELGMYRRTYSSTIGVHNAIQEESLRRTWWELFVIDGFMAALHRKTTFKTQSVSADILLPCEDSMYTDGSGLPEPLSLAQFDARLFAEDELQFSSLCYRIDAVRILARVIAIARTRDPHPDEIQAVDNALAGWVHHLPPGKSEVINTTGDLDEMMFQANMIIQYASMYLHCPRSDLTLPDSVDLSCGQSDSHVSPITTQHTHAIVAIDASKQLSNLAALRFPVRRHSPLFICCLVLTAMVQLSACVAYPRHSHQLGRDRLALIVGVLKSLTQNWALAHNALRLIRNATREVLELGSSQQTPPRVASTEDSGVDLQGPPDNTNKDTLSWMGINFDGLQDLINLDSDVPYFSAS